MKPARLRYARPSTLAEALELIAAAGEDAKVLAGGQSLIPMLNFRLARPSVLVDVTGIPDLQEVTLDDGVVTVGAAVRQVDAELSPVLAEQCPAIGRALRHVGHLQTRSRGTVVGSIAHADPAAELPAVALALDASLLVQSSSGRRELAAADLILGPYWTTLQPDEVITHVRFPAQPQSRAACCEVTRRAGDFALAGVVAVAVPDVDRAFDGMTTRLAAFGVGPKVSRLCGAERLLEDRPAEPDRVTAAATEAASEVETMGSGSADGRYRRGLIATLVRRALAEVCA